MLTDLARLISAARGQAPADLILANALVVNTFTGETENGSVAICGDRVAGVGDYRQASKVIDLAGKVVAPGLINGHTHLESSMLDVGQYARAVVPRGTLAVVTDLHEIANVCGKPGMRYMLDSARRLPLDLFLMAPSCVPATHLETSGATITAEDIRLMLRWKGCIGLGEVMNYPGVLAGDRGVLAKVEAARGKAVDGHAPGIRGKDLAGYIAAGIHSDHECISLSEAQDKLRQGMYIMVREGSSEKNLATLLPLISDKNGRCFFVVDDRSCFDLLNDGDIDAVVRRAVGLGLDPVRAIQMATINAAQYFRLEGLGAVAPGYLANLVVFNNLQELRAESVYYRGREVARGGQPLFDVAQSPARTICRTINVKPFNIEALAMPAVSGRSPLIDVIPGQIVTRMKLERMKARDGYIAADTHLDILKLAVVERHHASGNIGLGLVKGFGLKRGALASSVAHDSHNIVAVGASDADMLAAITEVERLQGGLVVVADGRILGSLALPIAGLLSDQPMERVVPEMQKLEEAARALGGTLAAPFATLSFLALPVIPELRLTDKGLVDVRQFKLIQ